MSNGKPMTEVLAGIYVNELHKMNPEAFGPWANLSDDARKAHMGAMHQISSVLKLFNIEVTINAQGEISTKRLESKPKRNGVQPEVVKRRTISHGEQRPTAMAPSPIPHTQLRQMGFTGNSCTDCGSMQMVSNGTCEKCMDCGGTSGCS